MVVSFVKSAVAALFLLPVAACGEVVITKPILSGPVRLVCLNPDGFMAHVPNLTRNQIIDVRAAANDGEIKWPCDDVQLPDGTVVTHERWIQSEDKWWVIGQTVQYPDGTIAATVDPLQAAYGRQPIQFKRYFGHGGDYFVPVIPRQRQRALPPRVNHRKMDVDEGQEFLRRELKRLEQ